MLELKLPGLHGIELIKKLRQSPLTSKLPVSVLTGFYKGDTSQAAARALGISYYLEKPLKTVDLMAAIHQKLNLTSSPTPASTGEARSFLQRLNASRSRTGINC